MRRRISREPIAISKGRFEAFSDGVFAIAITLLVLELKPPDASNAAMLIPALLALWPEYLVYVATFATIGIMWFNHYALFHNARSISYTAMIANLGLLFLISFLPFSTLLFARAGLVPPAAVVYGLTLLGLAFCFNVLWYSASVPPEEHGSVAGFIRERNAWNSIGLIVYSGGTLLALKSPLASIVLFALMALYYMLPSSVRGALNAAPADDLTPP